MEHTYHLSVTHTNSIHRAYLSPLPNHHTQNTLLSTQRFNRKGNKVITVRCYFNVISVNENNTHHFNKFSVVNATEFTRPGLLNSM